MTSSTRVALRPYNEAPRAVLADRRGTAIYQNSNSADTDTVSLLRSQRLRLLGIIGARAKLLADLAWEGGANG